jgi:hypothetical protein
LDPGGAIRPSLIGEWLICCSSATAHFLISQLHASASSQLHPYLSCDNLSLLPDAHAPSLAQTRHTHTLGTAAAAAAAAVARLFCWHDERDPASSLQLLIVQLGPR